MSRRPRSLRRRLARALLLIAGIGLLTATIGLLVVLGSDFAWARGLVEDAATRALGRTVEIRGPFAVTMRSRARLEAHDIRLANPASSSEPTMLRLASLSAELDLWSVLRGPLHIHRITIDGLELTLEEGGEGPPNWYFEALAGEESSTEPFELAIDELDLTRLQLSYRASSGAVPIRLEQAELHGREDSAGALDIALDGELNGSHLALTTRLGPLDELLAARESTARLAATWAGARLQLAARFQSFGALDGAELELDAEGDDLSRISAQLGLQTAPAESFRLHGKAAPAGEGSTLAVRAFVGAASAEINAVVDSLTHPEKVDLEMAASGPDLKAASAAWGVADAPAETFSLRGRVRWQGFPIDLDEVQLQVGANTLRLNGSLGEPPRLDQSRLDFAGDGPDLAALGAFVGLTLPAVPYHVDGHLERDDTGFRVNKAVAFVGATELEIDGRLGALPEMRDTELAIRARGPRLSAFSALAGYPLPEQPFAATLTASSTPHGIRIADARVNLGSSSARVDGEIVATDGARGSRFEVQLEGDDLSELGWIEVWDRWPSLPFSLAGTLTIEERALRLEHTTAELGSSSLSVDGLIGLRADGAGTSLELVAEGPDASIPAFFAALELPRQAYRAAGDLRLDAGAAHSEQLELRLGELELTLSGSVALDDPLRDSTLRLSCHGPRLADLPMLPPELRLPDAPFAVRAVGRSEGGVLHLAMTEIELDGHQLAADGRLVVSRDLAGTELNLDLRGPSLDSLGALAADLIELPALPGKPYTANGQITVAMDAYYLRGLHLTLGRARATIDGRLATSEGFAGSDLTLDLDGPDASLFSSFTGVTVPVAPFTASGRIEKAPEGLTFHDLRVGLGEYRARLDGRLGPAPRFVGSDLSFDASGPSLALVEQLSPLGELPDLPFGVSGTADGSPELFEIDELDLRLGDSDARGRILIALSEHPEIEARLNSRVIDLASLHQPDADEPGAGSTETPETAPDSSGMRLIPDDTLALSWLTRVDADVEWTVATLRTLTAEHLDIKALLSLRDGHLVLGPLEAVGARGGRLEAQLELIPEGETWRLDASLDLDDGKSDFTAGTGPAGAPLTNVDVKAALAASGGTLHELASSLNGNLIVSLEGGLVNASILDHISADLVLKILEALNPFKSKGTKTVGLQCAVVVVEIRDGIAVLEPMALKSENLTILGRGAVDLSTEKLDFEWATKARKGLGLNVSAMTNPYVKLGGSLGRPTIAVKPISALASTSLALATGGLSVLGQGLWDRLMSERKVCEKCLEEARRRREGKKPRKRSLVFQ